MDGVLSMCVRGFLLSTAAMQLQEFHKALLAEFEPLVMSYLDYLDKKMSVDLRNNFLQETWMPVMLVCSVRSYM